MKMIKTVKDLLEAQKAISSDTTSVVDVHEKAGGFFCFLFKSTKTRTQSATKIVKAYIDQCPQRNVNA